MAQCPETKSTIAQQHGLSLYTVECYFARWFFKQYPDETKLAVKFLKNRNNQYADAPERQRLLKAVHDYANKHHWQADALQSRIGHSFLQTSTKEIIALQPKPPKGSMTLPHGEFGYIRKGLWVHSISQDRVTLKAVKVPKKTMCAEDFSIVKNEGGITPRADHQAQTITVPRDNYKIPLVIRDYFPGKELFKLINDDLNHMPDDSRLAIVFNIALEVAKKIVFLHNEKKIVHRDLKVENIIVEVKNNRVVGVEIIDYGLSRMQGAKADNVLQGTFGTMAPEMLTTSNPHHVNSDMWSFGAILRDVIGVECRVNLSHLGVPRGFHKHVWHAKVAADYHYHLPELSEFCEQRLFVTLRNRASAKECVHKLRVIMQKRDIPEHNPAPDLALAQLKLSTAKPADGDKTSSQQQQPEPAIVKRNHTV